MNRKCSRQQIQPGAFFEAKRKRAIPSASFAAGIAIVYDTLIQTELSAVRRHLQHIVLISFYDTGMNPCCTVGELLNKGFLYLCRLCHDIVVLCFRYGKMKLIGGFYVGNLAEHGHEFRKIIEPGKPGTHTVSGAFDDRFVKRIFILFVENKNYQ